MADNDNNYGAQQSGEHSEAQQWLQNFWPKVTEEIRNMGPNDFKTQELPLARIKKIMKLDEDVKMISQEAPLLFAKAAEIFISELSLRSWLQTEDSKRRTLQKNDISMAISKYDQFDFLIDIVPRDIDTTKPAKRDGQESSGPVQYFFQMPQGQSSTQTQAIQLGQLPVGSQIVQIQAPTQQAQQAQQTQPTQPGGTAAVQQIQLTQTQLQAIQQQLQGRQSAEPIVIQTTTQADGSHQQTTFNAAQGQQVQYVQQQ